MPDMIILNVKVPPRLRDRIAACAAESGLSRAEWVRRALDEAATRSEAAAARRRRLEATK